MNPFAQLTQPDLTHRRALHHLTPLPGEEWRRMLDFLALSPTERQAMLQTVETLLRRGHELVVNTYDYLLQHEETAAILGWERGADPAHLAERRRFFTLWLTRLIGLDTSEELARYLFRAGKLHAGHGPRHTHVPPVYVTGSISLVMGSFARFLSEEMTGHPAVPTALAGWNKLLTAHLHLMQMGYQAALALDQGDFGLEVTLFGRMREVTGTHRLRVQVAEGTCMGQILTKLFNYFPEARSDILDVDWRSAEQVDHTGTPWFEAQRGYTLKPMWRVLNSGKDMAYLAGVETPLQPGDEIHIFPPGR